MDADSRRRQLRIYRRNLMYLRDQEAAFGEGLVPTYVIDQIRATEEKIAELEALNAAGGKDDDGS